jgi:uncharacterized Fe-S center protein
MPWINVEDCTACGICVEKCPVNTIILKDEEVEIEMDGCIRCGICHEVCPQEAIRHDSEKTSEIIDMNLEMTQKNMDLCAKYLDDEQEKIKCLNRMINHFNREKMIAEKTVAALEKLKWELN